MDGYMPKPTAERVELVEHVKNEFRSIQQAVSNKGADEVTLDDAKTCWLVRRFV